MEVFLVDKVRRNFYIFFLIIDSFFYRDIIMILLGLCKMIKYYIFII